ncbi:unnamed protein product [Arctia plantaginis]|uniref:L-serine deaminase n=1 Tax=Arctia plantaginis TaxID=874455 RepID=A0A8S1AJR0_ARCPL|nr:unnamed protein product [Arctia plantaginis]CAB3249270.1 unnamed protein product [Arctia plantaginis]
MKPDDIDFDEYCDPYNPRKCEYENILAASRRIVGQIVRTPLLQAQMSENLGMDLYLKQEFLQFTGNFKERGVRNTLLLLNDEQKKFGVVAASWGNHGCAVSYHSTQMGIPSIVVMPLLAAVTKVNNCEKLGAKLILFGDNITEAKHHAMTIAKEKKMMYLNGFDHPHVLEGQGTVGIEIYEQLPEVDAVLAPCGGGSLLAGVAVAIKHLKPDTEVYGIETDKTCSMTESLKKNERVFLPIDSSIADGLAVNKVGVNTFYTIKGPPPIVDKMVVVNEDWVARAVMRLVEEEKFVVEGSGATGVAALIAGLLPNLKGKKVVCICTGGNIDTTTMARALERGMASEGRLVKFKVTVRERPAGLAELCGLLSSMGATVRDCLPERAWIKGDVYSCEFKMTVETKGWSHAEEIEEAVKKHFKICFFPELKEKTNNLPTPRRGPCLAANPVCMQKNT